MLNEAEARGAEEQRRKDGVGYLFDNPDTGTEYLPYHPIESGECQYAENIREATSDELLSELQAAWTSWKEDREEKERVSANVAAMEAEIASLKEAEQLARADAEASKARGMTLEADAARFVWLIENGGCFWYGIPGFAPVSGRTTEDRVKDLLSAIDKNMARAALTREGGV